MLAIIERNILIYLRKKSNLLFSLLGAIIFFITYVLFLRKNILDSLGAVPHDNQLLDMWMLGALLTITAMTTSLSMMGQFVTDKNSNALLDLKISRTNFLRIFLGYFGASMVISFVMQGVVFSICWSYFSLSEHLSLSIPVVGKMMINGLLTSICVTGFACLICIFIRNETTLRGVNAAFGAGFGFLIGGYFPIGILSKTTQHIIQFCPLTYSVIWNRQLLMNPFWHAIQPSTRRYFEKFFGVQLTVNGFQITPKMIILILIITNIILISLIIFSIRKISNAIIIERN